MDERIGLKWAPRQAGRRARAPSRRTPSRGTRGRDATTGADPPIQERRGATASARRRSHAARASRRHPSSARAQPPTVALSSATRPRTPRAGPGPACAGPRPDAARRRRAPAPSASASDAVSAERNDSRRKPRSSSSGSTARLASVVINDQQRHLERDHRAVDERLDREVALAERAPVAEPREHGEALAARRAR